MRISVTIRLMFAAASFAGGAVKAEDTVFKTCGIWSCSYSHTFKDTELKVKANCDVAGGEDSGTDSMPNGLHCKPQSNATCHPTSKHSDATNPFMYCDCFLVDTSQKGTVDYTIDCP